MSARRPLSAVAAIGGFGIGVALLSVAATAAIVLIAPEPDGLRVSISDAATALKGQTKGFERRLGAEPQGRRAFVFESVLADQLRLPVGEVRIVMTGPLSATGSTPLTARLKQIPLQPVIVIHRSARQAADGAVQTRRTEETFQSNDTRILEQQIPPAIVRSGLATVPINAFVASVRQRDGRWLTVEPHQPWLSGWRLRVLAAILVSLLLIAPIAWIFARRLTRPFRALAAAVDARGGTVPIDGPRELREAASAIAAMRTRLADETAERLRMLTAIAHDLRTPLTSLRLRIENAQEPQRGRMVADVERMQAMIGEVLDFAQAARAEAQPLPLGPLVEEVVADMDAGRSLIVMAAPSDGLWVDAAESAARRAVENLVRNAVDYAGGGRVAVVRDGADAVVTVEDDGPGIADADLPRLLRPFERGEASRNRETGGAGLGLSIVQDFADRHEGALAVRPRAAGGLIVELRLPLRDRDRSPADARASAQA